MVSSEPLPRALLQDRENLITYYILLERPALVSSKLHAALKRVLLTWLLNVSGSFHHVHLISNKFKQRNEVHDRSTRNNKSLGILLNKTAAGQRSFSYQATHVWNNLPEDLKDHNLSFIQFKRELQSILFKEVFEY